MKKAGGKNKKTSAGRVDGPSDKRVDGPSDRMVDGDSRVDGASDSTASTALPSRANSPNGLSRGSAKAMDDAEDATKGRRRLKPLKKRDTNFARYIMRILKELESNARITKTAMQILNSFVEDMIERLAQEAGQLCFHTSKSTMGSKDVASAVRLLIPGDLGMHAKETGSETMERYMKYHVKPDGVKV